MHNIQWVSGFRIWRPDFLMPEAVKIDKAQDGDRVGIKTDNNKKGAGPDWLTP